MDPTADRPHMPGYGILGPDAGTGLLPWSWALERIAAARNFWVSTVTPEGGPHAMPVWAVCDDDALWFSTSVRSRKARNLAHDPRVVITTEDALDPVVIEGRAEVITDSAAIARFLGLSNAKYNVDYQLDFLDPAVNATIVVRPERAFGLLQSDFSGSPTRWMFSD
jgi:PPOX class probable F420-dependent enzyme